MQVYLDNAATTPIEPEVIRAMAPYLSEFYGNPSSQHAPGRKARVAIEQARKTIAGLIGASAAEIVFTSGGTEASNIFLQGIAGSINHIISSPIEHPAVLQTINTLVEQKKVTRSWVDLDEDGRVSLTSLEREIKANPQALVALMHGNNEIGNLLPLKEVADICTANNVAFFCDAVQTIGHLTLDLSSIALAGLSASAHKFHGPKGVGFLYIKKGTKISGVYKGGEQEYAVRPGTENVAAIVGMAKALAISYNSLATDRQHIENLKRTLKEQLMSAIPEVSFNGCSANQDESLYTILSVSLPAKDKNEMLIFNLDLENVYVSAGSACASGAAVASHVIEKLSGGKNRTVIRFSFSRFNTLEEIKYVIKTLLKVYAAS